MCVERRKGELPVSGYFDLDGVCAKELDIVIRVLKEGYDEAPSLWFLLDLEQLCLKCALVFGGEIGSGRIGSLDQLIFMISNSLDLDVSTLTWAACSTSSGCSVGRNSGPSIVASQTIHVI